MKNKKPQIHKQYSKITPGEFFKTGAIQVGGVIFKTPPYIIFNPISGLSHYLYYYYHYCYDVSLLFYKCLRNQA